MGTRTVIPFGPQHPVLPEPVHLDLVMEDEKIVEAIPSLGYVHRGLEKLAAKKDFNDMVFVSERICGICSFIHSMAYSTAIENIMKVEVPERAQYLRVMWAEMSRVHSHLLWLGLAADALGYESLFMHSWRVREKVLDVIEETSGGRVIFGTCKIGGVRRDVDAATLDKTLKMFDDIEVECQEIVHVFAGDPSVHKRVAGVGILSKDDAYALGAVGPVLRASGVTWDARKLGYAAYGKLEWEPVVETGCDVPARVLVRAKEIFQSIGLIRQAIKKMPKGPVEVRVTGNPNGETIMRVEQPRGELVYHIQANGTKNLARFRVRTPTFANIPPLVKMLPGCELADVPIIVLSIDPCISCTER
ncbi:MAG: nickel-dependent hydrogenase large subunit [Candidatus Coatesbacteria bacterium]